MSIFEALFLGIVQGITEFLPVSSSGHLVLFQHILGIQNIKNFIIFDITCHLGTLLAIFIVFKNDIKNIIMDNRKAFFAILISLLPLFPLLLVIKPIKSLFEDPRYLGLFFILTSILLYIGIKVGKDKTLKSESEPLNPSFKDAFIIGLFQAFAVLPGVSRSGSTITCARILGWNYEKAITFSFLMAIPTILGGVVVELLSLIKASSELPNISLIHYFSGFTTSFVFGLGSLIALKNITKNHNFIYFVWYCLFIGIITLIYLG